MPPQIALLGWGSLLWEPSHEFDEHRGDWRYNGPTLSLEFSRVSTSRLGALTLVIDEGHGVPTTTAWCLSKRARAEDAVADLRCREGCPLRHIARLDVPGADGQQPEGAAVAIAHWARERKLDVVVWTALPSNFQEEVQRPFELNAAIDYIQQLPAAAKVRAAEYVWRAPEFVKTPLRDALQQEPWFAPRRGG